MFAKRPGEHAQARIDQPFQNSIIRFRKNAVWKNYATDRLGLIKILIRALGMFVSSELWNIGKLRPSQEDGLGVVSVIFRVEFGVGRQFGWFAWLREIDQIKNVWLHRLFQFVGLLGMADLFDLV